MKEPDRALREKYGGHHDPELDKFNGYLTCKWISGESKDGTGPLTHVYRIKNGDGRIDFYITGMKHRGTAWREVVRMYPEARSQEAYDERVRNMCASKLDYLRKHGR